MSHVKVKIVVFCDCGRQTDATMSRFRWHTGGNPVLQVLGVEFPKTPTGSESLWVFNETEQKATCPDCL